MVHSMTDSNDFPTNQKPAPDSSGSQSPDKASSRNFDQNWLKLLIVGRLKPIVWLFILRLSNVCVCLPDIMVVVPVKMP